jgi:asparagine synthase (glutamine-hydrolysing)
LCGIGIIVSRKNISESELREKLERINVVQRHRGPDHSGCHFHPNVGLCHTRLSIIDLSEKANQPFVSEDGNSVIVYNGEVYNYTDLREDLSKLGYHFETRSDTEVLLKAYVAWGADSFRRFDGMFSFGILDKAKNRLIIARDRIGIKALHYFIDHEKIIIASEIKSILKVAGHIPYSHGSVNDILLLGHIEGSRTPFQGIYTLPPGTYAEIDLLAFSFENHPYHECLKEVAAEEYESNRKLSASRLSQNLDGLLQDSVRSHLTSDAPLGSLCSGGLDSSLITAIATKFDSDIELYHAGVEGGGGEERYAKLVADHLHLKIHTVAVNKRVYLDNLVAAIYHSDVPTYHPNDIPLYLVCKLANSHGVKVLLCGEGADELFGGYPWQIDFVRSLIRRSWIGDRFLKRLRRRLADVGFRHVDFPDRSLSDYVYSAGVTQPYGYIGNFMIMKNYAFLWNDGETLRRWNAILDSYHFLESLPEKCGNALLLDNMFGHLGSILHRTDRMGMMASIENRVPFLENAIIHFALNLPLKFKIKGGSGKWLLKQVAEKYLPKNTIYRSKQGFPVPWAEYISYKPALFRNGFMSEHFGLSHDLIGRVASGDSFLLFRLLAMEIWGRLFVRGEDLSSVQELVCRD